MTVIGSSAPRPNVPGPSMLGIGCTQSSITAPALTIAAEELLDRDARHPVRAGLSLDPNPAKPEPNRVR